MSRLAASRDELAKAPMLAESGDRLSKVARETPGRAEGDRNALAQLETRSTDTDYGEHAINADEANDRITKAEHIVEVIRRAIAGELGSEPAR
jgi:hypothetical protein